MRSLKICPPRLSLVVALGGLTVALMAPLPLRAQDRTPTNPLDDAPTPDAPPAPPPIPGPTTPLAPIQPRIAPVPGDLVVPLPGPGDAPPPLEELLPAAARQAGGLSEGQAIARGRKSALSVQVAEAQRRSNESAVTAAQLSFMPNVSFSARYTRLSDITPGTLGFFDTPSCIRDLPACQANPGAFQQQVVLQQPILNQYSFVASAGWNLTDLIGSRRLDLKAAEADAEAARASSESAEQSVVIEVVVAYWDVVRARSQAALASESLAVAAEQVDDAQERRAQGLVTEVEVLQTIGAQRGYERLLKVANNRVVLAETSFRHLLNLPPDDPIALDARLTELPTSPSTAKATMTRRAIERSPEVAAARARAEAAGARASSHEARLYPALTTSFNFNYDNPNPRIFPQEEKFTATWDASVQLSWSLDGTIIGVAQVDQLREVEAAQLIAVEQAEQAAEQTVIAARGNLEAALIGVESAQYSAGSTSVAARHARERFEAGFATATELMNAEAQKLSARLDLVDALVDARVAEADLKRALGSSSTPRKGD